jgi:hypothetical protein
MRKPGKKTRLWEEMLHIMNLLVSREEKLPQPKMRGQGRAAPAKAREPLITWVASRINPAEYPPPALHDLAAYLLWINAIMRRP